jgi:hypothetical protein
MPRPAPSLRPRLLAVAFGAVLAATAACSSTSESKPPTADDTTTTRSTPKRTTTTSASPAKTRVDVVKAYETAYAALATASGDPSAPQDSLTSHFEGQSLSFVKDELSRLAATGIRVMYPGNVPPVPSVTSVELSSPSDATAIVCLVDNGVQVRAATGEVVDDRVLSRATRGTLHLSFDGWKLSSAESTGDWNDGNGCDR